MGVGMVARVNTVAFEGVEARDVSVQVQLSPGVPAFAVVGLGDKAVAESRERVRSALTAIGLALPPKRITVNLDPADLPKEGSHYDLPIALALMTALGVLPQDAMDGFCVLGELGLDGSIAPVTGALPAAIAANGADRGLICPEACGPEAAWAGEMQIIAARSLLEVVNHVKGTQTLPAPRPAPPAQQAAPSPIWPTSRARRPPSGRWRSLRLAAITSCLSARRGQANPCWQAGCQVSCPPCRPAKCWMSPWSRPTTLTDIYLDKHHHYNEERVSEQLQHDS